MLLEQKKQLLPLKPQKIIYKADLKKDEIREFYKYFNKPITFVQNDYALKNNKKIYESVFMYDKDKKFHCAEELMISSEIINIREHLANNKDLIQKFLEKTDLTIEEKELFNSWKNFVYIEQGIVLQSHNNSQILVWDVSNQKVYLVYGLYDKLASLIPHRPFIGSFLLLPFKDRIVFDGLIVGENIELGNNIINNIKQEYQEIIDKNGIIMQLR